MTSNNKCLILPDAGDNVFFPGQHGEHATQTGGIKFFGDQMAARVYIDKHGIDHIVCIRPIRQQSEALMSPPLSFSLCVNRFYGIQTEINALLFRRGAPRRKSRCKAIACIQGKLSNRTAQ